MIKGHQRKHFSVSHNFALATTRAHNLESRKAYHHPIITMCVSTDSPTVSLRFKSSPLLPEAPYFGRVALKETKIANIEDICLPSSEQQPSSSGLRLSLRLSKNVSESRVQDGLLRMSKRSSSTPTEPKTELPITEQVVDASAVVERLSRLMQPDAKSSSSRRLTGATASKSRSSSPVPLVRGVDRKRSGTALCA